MCSNSSIVCLDSNGPNGQLKAPKSQIDKLFVRFQVAFQQTYRRWDFKLI